jgi:MYXO-CTERM domain-containing protein
MVRGSRTASRLVAPLALLCLLLLALPGCDTLHPEELDCEEAVAYLQKCCPSPPSPAVQCVYDNSSTIPGISQPGSTCIRAMSCVQLVDAGICGTLSAYESGQASKDSVCGPMPVTPPPVGDCAMATPARGSSSWPVGGAALAALVLLARRRGRRVTCR